MTNNLLTTPLRVQDELIEQPSWGGRYIVDLKGLGGDPAWAGKKVGQSYELSRESTLIDADRSIHALQDLLAADAVALLGQRVVDKHGVDLSLLIKLTQAKGNSFQVHLPEDKALGQWQPKPEAWFYLAPGLYTFGLNPAKDYDAYAQVLNTIDDEMQRLSAEVKSGRRTVDDARAQAHDRIQTLDPWAYVNTVVAETDDVVDLTAGGIHHSWEEDDRRFPDGNLVYEVQIDVPDDRCSMRGFDKGKFLGDGGLRPTHVQDYLATLEKDDAHNDLARHISKPKVVSDDAGVKTESVFRTPYFNMDRVTVSAGANWTADLSSGFRHVFVHAGSAAAAGAPYAQGQSYVLPAALGALELSAEKQTVLLVTYLPV